MKTVTFTKRAIQVLVGTLAVAASFSALASPVVTQWGFTVNSGFSAWTDSNNSAAGITASNNNALVSGFLGSPAPSLLSWGGAAGFGKSSLGVGAATNGYFSDTLTTNAAAVNTVKVIHNNVPVFDPSLTAATLYDVIQLQALTPGPDAPFFVPALSFGIKFKETPNSGICAVAASPTPCNDIFVLDVAGAGFAADNTLQQFFGYNGNGYYAVLSIAGLSVLEDSACAAAGAASGCRGLTTVEGLSNEFQVKLAINGVPEPETLALFGIALVGMSIVRRRKNAA